MIHFHVRLSKCKDSISLNGDRVDTVNDFKYLGLILDNYLCFDKHIDYVVGKTTMKLGVLYKTLWLFDFATA